MLGEKLLEFFHGAPERRTGRIPVRSAGRISFLRTEEVDWLEAQGDYVCLHAGAKKHLVRNRISVLEKQLGGSTFVRIHRSIIVNTDRIRELQPLTYGEYSVVLADGTRLTLSRSYRQHVLDLLTQVRSA
jgi:two-component system LytT family response regulator